MKIVTIGAGCHAALTHGPALAAIARQESELELAAVCDIRPERAVAFARQFGYRHIYTDFSEMLNVEKPDGVTLITPASVTARIGSAVLLRNIPLFLEKPPGRNGGEYGELLRAARLFSTPHLIAFNRRYMPLIGQARELWRNLTAGEKIQSIRCDFYRHNRHDPDFSETAIHGIDLVAHLAEAAYCSAAVQLQRNEKGEVATISLQGEFTNGINAHFLFCPVSGCSFERIHLVSENLGMTMELPALGCSDIPGRIILYQRGNLLREISAAAHPFRLEAFYQGGFYHENLAFIEMLKQPESRRKSADLENAASVVRVTETVSRALTASAVRRIPDPPESFSGIHAASFRWPL